MKTISIGHFYGNIHNKKKHFPLTGQIELTYRCNLNCVHCYCKGSEVRSQKSEVRGKRELTTEEWKEILDEIHKEGCLLFCLTGGDPLVRDDFLEIYAYAKEKGFLITLFTNGQAFTEDIIDYLVKSPPCSIEITLNGITRQTYEKITQISGSFSKVMHNIKILAEKKLPLILKTNCLKQNKYEITKIKRWTEEFLGKAAENKHNFRYDTMIYPRLNGDKSSCKYRLYSEEMLEIKKQDADIWEEHQKSMHGDFPDLKREKSFLYLCNAWLNQFFINPYGSLKFCQLSNKFSTNLKTTSFKETFYNWPSQILNERFKTNSKCQTCHLRPICYYCPARVYLETGNEEAPVPYYCELAKATVKEKERLACLADNFRQ